MTEQEKIEFLMVNIMGYHLGKGYHINKEFEGDWYTKDGYRVTAARNELARWNPFESLDDAAMLVTALDSTPEFKPELYGLYLRLCDEKAGSLTWNLLTLSARDRANCMVEAYQLFTGKLIDLF